jgi:superfamily II DNA or RNA helicase/HKD family nuclease
MPLRPGPYEHLITEEIAAELAALPAEAYATEVLGPAWMEDALARHVGRLVLRHLQAAEGEDPVRARLDAARRLLERLAEPLAASSGDPGQIAQRSDALTWIAPPRTGLERAERPVLPLHGLVHPALLFNGRADVSLLNELSRELATADAVDAIVAFLKPSGLRLLMEPLRSLRDRRGPEALRLITTTYTGATDAAAVEMLASLGFALKVAREDDGTRLHAKAWCFRRESGLSTVYVGSSNLSRSALVDGVEWNVRVTEALTPALLERFSTAFGQLWSELGPPYVPGRDQEVLAAELARARGEAPVGRAGVLRLGPQPKPHQARVLADLAAERRCGHRRNLVVAATGTGKTWIAAFDFQRLTAENGPLRLLFVAHRKEILTQSQQVFRDVLGDPAFGELLVDGERPQQGDHVFASIQSLARAQLRALPRDRYDVVIVDELHHAAADSYQELLDHLCPRWLVGLTATPERADGRSVLHWFDQRFAAELRLSDALAAGLLCPFHYFGVADGTEAEHAWKRGRVHLAELERVFTADDMQARRVLDAVRRYTNASRMRALGFCVGVGHALLMARAFTEAGLPAVAVHAGTSDAERREALTKLRQGALRAVFTVDLFNEGVDVPSADTVLFLRPTESEAVFLQQLGRGLRKHPGKEVLTVLDFVGRLHRDFRWETRFAPFVAGTRREVAAQIEAGFPRLPPGCAIQLEPAARAIVLAHLRERSGAVWRRMVDDLRQLGPETTLGDFLRQSGASLEELYAADRGWTRLRREAGLEPRPPGPDERSLQPRLGRLLHVNDPARLDTWRRWLRQTQAPAQESANEQPLVWMLFATLGDRKRPVDQIGAELAQFWAHSPLREELAQLLDLCADRPRHDRGPLPGTPLHLHARYSRDEIVAAWQVAAKGRLRELREGVLWVERARTDLLFVTLDKSEQLRAQLRYADHAVDPLTFHWESQNGTTAALGVGLRYQQHESQRSRVLLFVRERRRDAAGRTLPYTCLGHVRYLSHKGDRPMQILWRLDEPMPNWVFAAGRATA